MRKIGFFFMCGLFFFCFAQRTKSQPLIYSDSLSSQDVSILYQNDTINIIGKKYGFIFYEFARKTRIKILNNNGLRSFSKYKIPETYDPSYISQSPKVRNCGYYLTRIKISFFKVKIYKEDGTTSEFQIVPTEREIKSVITNDKYGIFYEYIFDISGFKVGDEVEISYSYGVPFDENISKLLSFRLFPHSYYNIENYQLTITHDKDLVVDFEYFNSFNPDSVGLDKGNKFFMWFKTHLPGCMGEASGRPYKSLPYLVFSIKPSEVSYYIPNTFTKKALPGYYIPVYFRENNFYTTILNVGNNVQMRDYPALYAFVENNLGETASDTLGYYKLDKLQTVITDKFSYDDNQTFFNDQYITDPHWGASVGSEKIQEVSRYYFYVAWITKLKLFFYSAYLADIRSGEINERYYAPMFSDDFLFAVQFKQGKVVFLYPKKANFGFYTDEMPFYFEGARTRLVCIEDYVDDRVPINEDFRNIITPTSAWNDNSRKSKIQVNVNNSGTCVFTSSVSLTGQFSTMTRGAYLSNYNDLTVNPLYSHKIWDLSSSTKLLSSNVDIQQKNFPFKTIIKAEYESSGFVSKISDSNYMLKLKNLFPHIISSSLNEVHRVLDFYPDFKEQDIFTYFFKFETPIELVKNVESQKISNSFGELIIESQLMDQNGLRIISCLSINTDYVKAANINDVSQIFEAIRKLNDSEIVYKIKQ
jgi:hypothetical protein